MAPNYSRESASTSRSGSKSNEKKIYNSKDYNHDTSTLRVQAKQLYEGAKSVDKEQKKIQRKLLKANSRQIDGCIDKYNTGLSEMRNSVERIESIVKRNEESIKLTQGASSMREKRTKTRKTIQEEALRGHETECFQCFNKEEKLKQLQDTITGLEDNLKRNKREHEEYLNQSLRSKEELEKHLQRKYEEEVNAKEDALRSLDQSLRSKEEHEKHLQRKYQEEVNAKEDALRSLDQIRRSKDEIEKHLQQKYQEEVNAKEGALRSLDQIRRSKDEIEKHLQQKYQEEVNAKEGALRSLDQIRRLKDENEKHLQQKYQEAANAKEDALRSLDQIRRSKDDIEKPLQRKYQEELKAKEDTLRSLDQSLRSKEEHEKHLQRKYQEVVNAKEDALRSLDQIRRSKDEIEMNLQRKYQEEVNAKEGALRSLDQFRLSKDESERHLQRKYQEEVNAKEDALQSLDHIRRSTGEIEKLFQGKYQEEVNAKEDALRSLDQIRRSKDEIEKLLQRKYQEEVNAKEEALRSLDQSLRSKEEIEKHLQRKYQEEVNAKEDALRRLSALASSKLRDNNPNITDLSDQNRPTKIAEKMSELYDNQWTDAFDVLEREMMEERQIIQKLLDTLMAVYDECRRLTGNENSFFERVQQSIILPSEEGSIAGTEIVLPDQLKQQLKEFRKMRATYFAEDIAKVVKSKIPLAKHPATEVQGYMSQCIEIGWLCAVQDPPLVFSAKSPQKFDTNLFKDYTKRGKYVDYIVWPAVFLSDGGALLAKGVAQGTNQEQTEGYSKNEQPSHVYYVPVQAASVGNVSQNQYRQDSLQGMVQDQQAQIIHAQGLGIPSNTVMTPNYTQKAQTVYHGTRTNNQKSSQTVYQRPNTEAGGDTNFTDI